MANPEGDRDVDDAAYAVTSNVPVEINNPQRKAKLIAAAWVVALLMCTFASGYIASLIAIEQNDDAKRQLQQEMAYRSKQRDDENARMREMIDNYRRDQCQVTAKLPQTPDIVEIRSRYRCSNEVTPPARASAAPSGAPALPGAPAPSDTRGGVVLTSRPRAEPGTSQPPAAGPGGSPGVLPPPAPPPPPGPVTVPPLVPVPLPLPVICLLAVAATICLEF